MKLHLKILGYVYMISGGLGVIMAMAIGISITYGGGPYAIAGLDAAFVERYLLAILTVLLLASGLSLVEGVGLLKLKPWARSLGFALGILSLLDFPVGTVIGVYTLWILWQKDTVTLFRTVAPAKPKMIKTQ